MKHVEYLISHYARELPDKLHEYIIASLYRPNIHNPQVQHADLIQEFLDPEKTRDQKLVYIEILIVDVLFRLKSAGAITTSSVVDFTFSLIHPDLYGGIIKYHHIRNALTRLKNHNCLSVGRRQIQFTDEFTQHLGNVLTINVQQKT